MGWRRVYSFPALPESDRGHCSVPVPPFQNNCLGRETPSHWGARAAATVAMTKNVTSSLLHQSDKKEARPGVCKLCFWELLRVCARWVKGVSSHRTQFIESGSLYLLWNFPLTLSGARTKALKFYLNFLPAQWLCKIVLNFTVISPQRQQRDSPDMNRLWGQRPWWLSSIWMLNMEILGHCSLASLWIGWKPTWTWEPGDHQQRAGSSISSCRGWWAGNSMSIPASKVARVERCVEDLTNH